LAFVPCERRRCVVRRTAISAGSEAGSSSGEGSPWAEQEVLAGSPEGRTSTITKPPEVVASRAGDLTPWSAGGSGPARNACDRSTTLQRFPEVAPDFPGRATVRAGPAGCFRKLVGKSLGSGGGGTSRWSVSHLPSPWRPALRPWLRCPRILDARLAPWPPPGAAEQMDSSDRGRPRWPYDPLGDGTPSDHPETVVVVSAPRSCR
jgi:hypothetical protein